VSDGALKLIIEDGVCRDIETMGGRRYIAAKVLISAGAETARLLVESFPNQLDLHAFYRFVPAAILEGNVKLMEGQVQMCRSTPAVLWDLETVKGEVMPLTEDEYLKIFRRIPCAKQRTSPDLKHQGIKTT
jgi:sarcosine oxidase/L-pipecolate oxidase